jgi:predicted alpha-1,2-mannosidase
MTMRIKQLLNVLLFATSSLSLFSCGNLIPERENYIQYVNPFIGGSATGHTFPGACRPFGLIQASPETNAIGWDYCSGYRFSDSLIWGFSQTHLNGTGCMDLGDILIQPVSGLRVRDDYKSTFDSASQKASPGYYAVHLNQPDVFAEITATAHVAMYRFTYAKEDTTSLMVDFQHGLVNSEQSYRGRVSTFTIQKKDAYTFTGETRRSMWVNRSFAYVLKFDKPVTDYIELAPKEGEVGKRVVFTFDLKKGDDLKVKVALSTTSEEGAAKNMEAELSSWNFDRTLSTAQLEWNNYLKRVRMTGTREQKENFYTSFYHMLIQPNNIADVDGAYRGVDDSVAHAKGNEYYSTFSLWDTYRAAHPLYTILVPEKVDPFVNSMIAHADRQGFLPIWTLWGKENFCMIGDHAIPVIVDAYLKGFKGFDPEAAYQAIKKSLTTSHQKSQWEVLDKYGYFPTDLIATESVSRTLETCYDNYAAAVMARKLGKEEDALLFEKRASYYKNMFDPSTKLMRPRLADGSWYAPFNPYSLAHSESKGGDYTEGNAWQYTWHVQHDVKGLMEMYGSPELFKLKLDSLFSLSASLFDTPLSDVTGLIGQYAHGNEPSHHIPYLYNVAGYPARTQELIREIFDTQYKNEPDGLCGNDDCGQMSAWYMFSAMGFYPLSPVGGEYILGAPQMERFELFLPYNKKFIVIAEDLSKENKYVEFVMLDNKILDRNYITQEEIMQGGTLQFMMTNRPSVKQK